MASCETRRVGRGRSRRRGSLLVALRLRLDFGVEGAGRARRIAAASAAAALLFLMRASTSRLRLRRRGSGVLDDLFLCLGIPLLQIIFVRAVISVALSLADIYRAGVHPLGHRRVLLFGRGLSGFLALTGVFYALLHLSMA